jgi:hypothetical protein
MRLTLLLVIASRADLSASTVRRFSISSHICGHASSNAASVPPLAFHERLARYLARRSSASAFSSRERLSLAFRSSLRLLSSAESASLRFLACSESYLILACLRSSPAASSALMRSTSLRARFSNDLFVAIALCAPFVGTFLPV